MQHQQQSAMERITAIFGGQSVIPVPRGELWLGSQLFQYTDLTDTVANHFRLAEQLGQDMVCLPVAADLGQVPDLGYRYFEVGDLAGVTRHGDCFVAAVVDGPFQALVNRRGLMAVLMAWIRQRQEFVDAYAAQQAETIRLIGSCLAQGVHGIVIADDMAADQGPLVSPAEIESLCGSFYLQAVRAIHGANGAALLHCCGNINQLVTVFKGWGIDGLAAVQHRINDLASLRKTWGGPLVIMAGIDADLLESDRPPSSALTSLDDLVTSLATGGGLILGSACGLYRGAFLSRIKRLYTRVDRLFEG